MHSDLRITLTALCLWFLLPSCVLSDLLIRLWCAMRLGLHYFSLQFHTLREVSQAEGLHVWRSWHSRQLTILSAMLHGVSADLHVFLSDFI
jgi:hypothetical protein